MENAPKEVTECKLSVRRAALQYGLPKPRLHDQVSGRVIPGVKLGAPWYLDNEEEELLKFLIGSADIDYPQTV